MTRRDLPPPITFETEEPEHLLEEVIAAVHQVKARKAPGLDNVPAELLKQGSPTYGPRAKSGPPRHFVQSLE